MASRKLTQLPTATEVTASDKIYIVDVSDMSESPQGTSKQAVISNLPSSGITSLTSTDGSIDIDLTDPSAPDLSIPSGAFTPTISEVTNDAIVSISDCFFAKVGKWGNLSFILDCQMDGASSGASFKITLPFTTNNISVLTFGNQSLVVDNILSSANGAFAFLSPQSLNVGDNIEKLEVSINFFLA